MPSLDRCATRCITSVKIATPASGCRSVQPTPRAVCLVLDLHVAKCEDEHELARVPELGEVETWEPHARRRVLDPALVCVRRLRFLDVRLGLHSRPFARASPPRPPASARPCHLGSGILVEQHADSLQRGAYMYGAVPSTTVVFEGAHVGEIAEALRQLADTRSSVFRSTGTKKEMKGCRWTNRISPPSRWYAEMIRTESSLPRFLVLLGASAFLARPRRHSVRWRAPDRPRDKMGRLAYRRRSC